MLAHSFDRFYVVSRIEIPKVLDLNLTVFQFDHNCSHVAHIEKDTKFKIPSTIKDMFKVYCRNIIPYMYFYKHQVECRLKYFLKNRTLILLRDKLLPVSNMASSRSEENVYLNYFQHQMVSQCWMSLQFYRDLFVLFLLADVIANVVYQIWMVVVANFC